MANPVSHAYILVGIAAALLTVRPEATPQSDLPLTPVFFNTEGHNAFTLNVQNTPRFAYSFTNTTNKDVDLPRLCNHSVLILDGKRYAGPTFNWFGNPVLRPGERWDSTLTVKEYLPAAQQPEWKWSEAALSSGRHTLSLQFGSKQYGPVSFVWQNQSVP